LRVLGDCRSHPGVRKLQKQRAPRTEEDHRFSINAPHDGIRTKDAGKGSRCGFSNGRELTPQLGLKDFWARLVLIH